MGRLSARTDGQDRVRKDEVGINWLIDRKHSPYKSTMSSDVLNMHNSYEFFNSPTVRMN